MTAPTATIISFRLGGTDGVSVEVRKWEWALQQCGFAIRRVAGELVDGLRPDDVCLPHLAIDPEVGVESDGGALAASLDGSALVVVENLCSLPLNLDASRLAVDVLAEHRGRVVFHHHDLPWERPHLAHLVEFPPVRENSLHVTINDAARRALAERAIEATTIRNAFDLDPRPGDRAGTRASFGFADDELVILQPTRAIPRKEVAGGIAFTEQLAAALPTRAVRYWLTGPAEDGFDVELDRLLAAARVPVTLGRAEQASDAYAASDIVVFPSSWEGFGNPVIEATIANRPVAAARYPVLEELRALGLEVFDVDDPQSVLAVVDHHEEALTAGNQQVLRANFDLADLPRRLVDAFATVGWQHW